MSIHLALLSGPGARAATGAGLRLQEPHPAAVESPLPGGVAQLVRFFFNVPQWIQIAGFFVGVLVALWVVVLLWRRRTTILHWVTTRNRRIRLALAGAAGVLAIAFAASGYASWSYMQHDNGFCTGCHVMGPAFQRFTQSEHDSLACHDCHQQSIFASARQLYLWVAERPQEIGPHAKVPNAVCANCHITGQQEVWQRIASTAGHRTHLESDSASLKNLQCVTCHGVEVHHFAPVDSTCAQANCHVNTGIVLGGMARQTALHCTTCHQFTADVPRFVTRDSARGTLVPGDKQCLGCHEMQQVLATFDPARDPHGGTCGMCHNPHTQKRPADAKLTCTTAACHADWRQEPFHVGASHRRTSEDCTTCHLPHQARVDASDCAGCHTTVRNRKGGRVSPPLPFDTSAALRRVSLAAPPAAPRKGKGDAPFVDDPPTLEAPRAAADTFPHYRHTSLSCITCHVLQTGRGRLTFEPPRGCQICHHQAPTTLDCATCHRKDALTPPESVSVRVAVTRSPVRSHPALFEHAAHDRLKCVDCHTTPVSLEPQAETLTCSACHDDHHVAGRLCVACHSSTGSEARTAHTPPVDAHRACDACHLPDIVARLLPDRALCVTCHTAQRDHYTAQECTVCHFQASPVEYQVHLRRVGNGS